MNTDKAEFIKTVESIGNDFMESMFLSRTIYYVDLDYFFDFRLTALLCLMSEVDYEILKPCMFLYNNRTRPGTVEHFPGIGITDEQIDVYLADIPDMQEYAQKLQTTEYFIAFSELMRGWNVKNKLSGEKQSMTLLIGRKGYALPTHHYNILKSYLLDRVPDLDIRFVEGGVGNQHSQFIDHVHHVSVTDLREFTNSPSVQPYIEDGTIIGKSIHTLPMVLEPEENITDKELLVNTNDYFNTYFEFEYIAARALYV